MGVSNWLHWTAWYCSTLLFVSIEVVIIVVFLSVPIFRKDSVFVLVPANILFSYFMLYAPSFITFAFAVTVFFQKCLYTPLWRNLCVVLILYYLSAYVALIVGTILFVLTMVPFFFTTTFGEKFAACFLTNSAAMYGLDVMMKYEIFEKSKSN